MAALAAVNAVVAGVAQHLTRARQLSPISDVSCTFQAVGTTDFKKLDGRETTCSIFLYRITHNEHTRNLLPRTTRRVLTVNMHLLITVWADTPLREHLLLAWVMRELHQHPVLDRSVLAGNGQFANSDQVQFIPEELTLDDMSKLWQALVPPYRTSITYVARNVPIGFDEDEVFAPAAATRFELTDEMEQAEKA